MVSHMSQIGRLVIAAAFALSLAGAGLPARTDPDAGITRISLPLEWAGTALAKPGNDKGNSGNQGDDNNGNSGNNGDGGVANPGDGGDSGGNANGHGGGNSSDGRG